MSNGYYNINPRYSAGSPASLNNPVIAETVCAEEKEFHQAALEGLWGAAWQARAQTEGLSGIVEFCWSHGNRRYCRDLITHELRSEKR